MKIKKVLSLALSLAMLLTISSCSKPAGGSQSAASNPGGSASSTGDSGGGSEPACEPLNIVWGDYHATTMPMGQCGILGGAGEGKIRWRYHSGAVSRGAAGLSG